MSFGIYLDIGACDLEFHDESPLPARIIQLDSPVSCVTEIDIERAVGNFCNHGRAALECAAPGDEIMEARTGAEEQSF